MHRKPSLRAQLLARLIVPLLLMLLVVSVGGYTIINRPSVVAYDQSLANAALAVAQLVSRDPGAGKELRFDFPRQAEEVLRMDRYDTIYFLVLDGEGQVLAGDVGLPLPPSIPSLEEGWIGYDTEFQGQSVRAVAMERRVGDSNVTVLVAETRHKRESLAWGIGLGMLVPEVLLMAGLVGIVWHGVGKALLPLEALREQIQARSHLDLSPLDERPAVLEVRPLVVEINELLQRLAQANDAQQRFIANAAHQLRTPLAGLQTQLELTLAEDDPVARQSRLEQCRQATGRTARLVNQLLALSAVEARDEGAPAELDLSLLLRERADAWVRRAIEKDIDFGLELRKAPIQGDALLIGEMASNLVDNALAYTSSGGQVTLCCGQGGDGVSFLSVVDNGPGIPPEARERVMERFFRLPGSPGIGSGLGLAIVHEIADHHGARVLIEDAPGASGGTLVSVHFEGFRKT